MWVMCSVLIPHRGASSGARGSGILRLVNADLIVLQQIRAGASKQTRPLTTSSPLSPEMTSSFE